MLVKHNLPICQRQHRQKREKERNGKLQREPLGAPAICGGGEKLEQESKGEKSGGVGKKDKDCPKPWFLARYQRCLTLTPSSVLISLLENFKGLNVCYMCMCVCIHARPIYSLSNTWWVVKKVFHILNWVLFCSLLTLPEIRKFLTCLFVFVVRKSESYSLLFIIILHFFRYGCKFHG